MAILAMPATGFPLLASDKPSHDIAGLVYNGLVKYDKKHE